MSTGLDSAHCNTVSRMPVVVDCSHMYHVDYTAAAQFTDMLTEFSSRQQVSTGHTVHSLNTVL